MNFFESLYPVIRNFRESQNFDGLGVRRLPESFKKIPRNPRCSDPPTQPCGDATALSKSNRWRLLKLNKIKWLVLGCMDSYDSNQILILQHFSRSTRFSYFCTAQISKFQRKPVQIVAGMKIFIFFTCLDKICDFSAKF